MIFITDILLVNILHIFMIDRNVCVCLSEPILLKNVHYQYEILASQNHTPIIFIINIHYYPFHKKSSNKKQKM